VKTFALIPARSGFIRIRRALHDYPEMQFAIAEKFGGVMVTFAQTNRPADSGAPQVTPQVEQLLAVIQGDMTRQALMAALELNDRKHFANTYLKAALAAGVIEMTLPDKPNSRQQKYRKTGSQP